MIRPFDRDRDLKACVAMAEDLLRESPGHKGLTVDPAYIAWNMTREGVQGWVNEREGELNGYCFATVTPCFFGPDLICADLSIYVKPEARNGFVAWRLLQRMEAWGRSMGAKIHVHAVSTGIRGATSLYLGAGYTSMGGVYVKSAFKRT